MGWFDESDDSEDERQKPKQQQITTTTVRSDSGNNNDNNNTNDDEEEDPLDAYMKSLGDPSSSAVPTQTKNSTRLDLQNEDEYEYDNYNDNRRNETKSSLHFSGNGDEYDYNDEGTWQQQQTSKGQTANNNSKSTLSANNLARTALKSTFRKAGGEQIDDNNDDDENDFYNTETRRTTNKQQEFNNNSDPDDNEVPEAVTKSYEPFEKNFWNGSYTNEGQNWCRSNDIRCTRLQARQQHYSSTNSESNNTDSTSRTIDPIYDFCELRDVMGTDLLQKIIANYSKPTLVQSQTLPLALAGQDAIVTAATGQGKTLAYLWPIAVHLANQPPLRAELHETGPIALVLVPTRELALQVQQQAKIFLPSALPKSGSGGGGGTGALQCRAVIGGVGKFILRQELKKMGGVDLVIATPGRLLDVLSDKKGLSLQRVTFVVLDEADKMLHMGFETDVRKILSNIRTDRQTLMMSATMGNRVEKVASEWLLPNAVRVSVGRTGESSHHVNQQAIILPSNSAKEAFLVEMLPTLVQVGRIIIFVATRDGCEALAVSLSNKLSSVGTIRIQTLHGDKHQTDRNAAVRSFTKGDVNVLIATDIAGRGLDIPNVQTVLSFDPAKNLDTHVHRIGRAGRLSKDPTNNNNKNHEQQQRTGTAYTLLTPKDADFAKVLVNAFEREGREVSTDLRSLANTSRYNHGHYGDTRDTKINKTAGLGHGPAQNYIYTSSQAYASSSSGYNTNDTSIERVGKRSRWN